MLFLFNNAILDIGDPQETACEIGPRHGLDEQALRNLTLGKTVKMLREAVFEEAQLARTNTELAVFLAAMLAWKTDEANALLAVSPRHITSAKEVQLRLASVSLVTMNQLGELQEQGKLSSHVANTSVWQHAPRRMQA